jgi:hypothetical protein
MDDPALRSRSASLTSAPEDFTSADLSSSSQGIGERIGVGVILCLAGLGIAAAATIVAFFGTGYLLLTERPTEIARSEPKAAVVAEDAATVRTGEPSLLPALPPSKHEPAASSGTEGATVPGGPAGNPSASTAAVSTAPGKITSGEVQLTPAPGFRADAAPSAATSGAPSESASARPGDGGANTTTQPPPSTPLSTAEINAILAQGDDAFRRGDLASARLLYQRAFEADDGRGALGIGASYDPLFLRRYRISSEPGDLDEARTWYQRARALGAEEAQTRLKRLNNAAR